MVNPFASLLQLVCGCNDQDFVLGFSVFHIEAPGLLFNCLLKISLFDVSIGHSGKLNVKGFMLEASNWDGYH